MAKYRGNEFYASLSLREQEIVGYYDVVSPLRDDTTEMSLDVLLASNFPALPLKLLRQDEI